MKNKNNIFKTDKTALNSIENEVLLSKDEENLKPEMILKFEKMLENMYYMSETDALIEFEFSNLKDINLLKQEISLKHKKKQIQELNWEEFFANKIEIQDWHDDFMKELTQKMLELKSYLTSDFKSIVYLKIGKIEIDAYLIAQKENLEIVVLKTKIVET